MWRGHCSTTVHLLNVCIALLRRSEVTRCCVVWSHYWEEDIRMAERGTMDGRAIEGGGEGNSECERE